MEAEVRRPAMPLRWSGSGYRVVGMDPGGAAGGGVETASIRRASSRGVFSAESSGRRPAAVDLFQTQNVPLFSSPAAAGDEGPIEAFAETDVHRYQKIRLKEPHTLSDQE